METPPLSLLLNNKHCMVRGQFPNSQRPIVFASDSILIPYVV